MNPSTQSKKLTQEPTFLTKHALLETLIRYIVHKQRIFMKSKYYNISLKYMTHMSRAGDVKQWAHLSAPTLPMINVCRFILTMRNHLEGILPHPNNTSSRHQREILDSIIKTCKHETEKSN